MTSFSLPAPPFLISFFIYLTLFFHLIIVNLVLGSSFLIAIYLFKGKQKHLNIARSMASRLPYFMAFLITFGVAPLLFLQAMYPSLFYNSLINFSLPSFLILLSIFVSYTLLYIGSKKWDLIRFPKAVLYLVVAILLLFVMFVFNNIMSFIENAKETPSLFLNSKYGFNFHLSSPTLLARFFHFFFSSIGLSGLWVAIWGVMKLKKEPEQGRWQYRSGATYFSSSTILVMVTGLWWLLVLPNESASIVLGKSVFYTTIFVLLIISSIGSLVFALLGMNSIKPSMFLRITGILTTFNVFAMIVLRGALREKQIRDLVDISKSEVNFKLYSFLLFLFFLAIGTFVIIDTIKKVGKEIRKQ
jgi:hypothetical protein